MKFLRKNNDLGAGPPKYPILVEFNENDKKSTILMILTIKSREFVKMVIFGDSE